MWWMLTQPWSLPDWCGPLKWPVTMLPFCWSWTVLRELPCFSMFSA